MKLILYLACFLIISAKSFQSKTPLPNLRLIFKESNGVSYCGDAYKYNYTLDQELIKSPDMAAQIVSINLDVPFEILTKYVFLSQWVEWNQLFNTVQTTNFSLCHSLDAVYSNSQFLIPILPKTLDGPHYIIQKGCSEDKKTCAYAWFFKLIDTSNKELITFGRHTLTFEEDVQGNTIMSSYEKVAGINVKKNSIAWTNALQESLVDQVVGGICLERVYKSTGFLNPSDVANFCLHFVP